jgi:hypothetical protein
VRHFCGPSFIYPSEEDYVGSTRVFSALHQKLLESEKLALVPGGIFCTPFSSIFSAPAIIAAKTGEAFLRGMNQIYPSEEDYVGSTRVFSALHQKLLESEKLALVWFLAQNGRADSGLNPIIRITGSPKLLSACCSSMVNDTNVKHPSFIYPSEEDYVGSTRVFSALHQKLLESETGEAFLRGMNQTKASFSDSRSF